MSALAFAGGAVVGASSGMFVTRTLFEKSTENVMVLLQQVDACDLKVENMSVAYDILSASKAITQLSDIDRIGSFTWFTYSSLQQDKKNKFELAIRNLRTKYLAVAAPQHTPVPTKAAWPVTAGLAGLSAGSAAGFLLTRGTLSLSKKYLLSLNIFKHFHGEIEKAMFLHNALCMALRLNLCRDELPSLPISSFDGGDAMIQVLDSL